MSEKSESRSKRKREHVEAFKKNDFLANNYFEDIYLEHNALPEINFNQIETSTLFVGKQVGFPIMINAMTGGFDEAIMINGGLASVAKRLNIPMAVGSQSIAVADKAYEKSFRIVREKIGSGIVLANLNGFASLEHAKKAIEMLEADGLQIHLNPAQEMCMNEGDRDFVGVLKNIEHMVKSIQIPVIVKEVGFGMSKKQAQNLYDIGVSYVDVAGSGGTNFIQIENDRHSDKDFSEFFSWGIPTALSLIECNRVRGRKGLIASGGIRQADEVVKALVVGADMVGMSGAVLREFLNHGQEGTYAYISDIIYKSKILMMLLGAKNLKELKEKPYRVTGKLRELLQGEIHD